MSIIMLLVTIWMLPLTLHTNWHLSQPTCQDWVKKAMITQCSNRVHFRTVTNADSTQFWNCSECRSCLWIIIIQNICRCSWLDSFLSIHQPHLPMLCSLCYCHHLYLPLNDHDNWIDRQTYSCIIFSFYFLTPNVLWLFYNEFSKTRLGY